MKKTLYHLLLLFVSTTVLLNSACSDDDNADIQPTPTPIPVPDVFHTPTEYSFIRNGLSSVDYQGQTDRLNQLSEIKAMLGQADAGNVVSAQTLKDMFANVNNNGNGHFSFSSNKQLKNKTFVLDQQYFEALFDTLEIASKEGARGKIASKGVAGLATRPSGKTILLDKNGREFTQLIEKGLMGATFYHQIVNNYLTDALIGDAVNNTDLESGKNFTEMEHHFDEAFGYFGAPIDFKSNYSGTTAVRFWANYSNIADPHIQMNDRLMNAYKRGRAAIVQNRKGIKDQEVDNLNKEFEVLVAATAIHYANASKQEASDAERMHLLSECYAFTQALRYSNALHRKINHTEVDDLLKSKIGYNLWLTTKADLNLLIDQLASTYGLIEVKNEL